MSGQENVVEKRIFIVESDRMLRDSLTSLFQAKRCCVRAFPSAEEAIPFLEAGAADVLVCGQDLPGMDGLDLLARIGAILPRAVLMVLICSHLTARLSEEMKRLRIDGCLLKPFSTEEFEQVLSCVL